MNKETEKLILELGLSENYNYWISKFLAALPNIPTNKTYKIIASIPNSETNIIAHISSQSIEALSSYETPSYKTPLTDAQKAIKENKTEVEPTPEEEAWILNLCHNLPSTTYDKKGVYKVTASIPNSDKLISVFLCWNGHYNATTYKKPTAMPLTEAHRAALSAR